MSDSAQSFLPQILDAWANVQKAEGDTLKCAIDCGNALNLAKENVEAERKKWGSWLKTNTQIPQTTASLYMRLDTHRDLLKDVSSIRKAIKLLPKTRNRTPSQNGASAGGGGGDQPTFEKQFDSHLNELAEDELAAKLEPEKLDALAERKLKALKENDKQRKEFIVSLLEELSIEDVADVLSEAFKDEKLEKLIKALNGEDDGVESDGLDIPPSLQRNPDIVRRA
jgi:hypothetical protein